RSAATRSKRPASHGRKRRRAHSWRRCARNMRSRGILTMPRRGCGTMASSIRSTPAWCWGSVSRRPSTRRSARAASASFACERMASLLIETGPVATVTLNRPERHNAFDEQLIAELTLAFEDLGKDESVRVIILAASGKSFSAGGDLNWMRRAAGYGRAENIADAAALAELLRTLDELRKPTLARV